MIGLSAAEVASVISLNAVTAVFSAIFLIELKETESVNMSRRPTPLDSGFAHYFIETILKLLDIQSLGPL